MLRYITIGVAAVSAAVVVSQATGASPRTAMQPVASAATSCESTNSCTPTTFAEAVLIDIGAPTTPANLFAMRVWEKSEGGGAGCPGQPPNKAPWSYSPGPWGNPLGTTQRNPGSRSKNWNGDGVQAYVDAAGHTCWYWGIQATGKTITGLHPNIHKALVEPSAGNTEQCNHLKREVTNSNFPLWGTPAAGWASCYKEP